MSSLKSRGVQHFPQKFDQLFWFQQPGGSLEHQSRFYCFKTNDDEVYKIREMTCVSGNIWVTKSERYMTREKYEAFLASKSIIKSML